MSKKYQQQGQHYFLRLDLGEELIQSLTTFCVAQSIFCGHIYGIGAMQSVTLGFFDPVSKEYQQRDFTLACEMTSLLGTVSRKEGECYLHLHANFSGSDFCTFGGHLVSATVSSTAELGIIAVDTKIEREFHLGIGLNLFKF